MKRLSALIFAAFVLCAHVAARAESPITTLAEYALLMDHKTGAVLFEKNADTPTAPASMSKLMTVAIVFERLKEGSLKLSDKLHVSEKAWRKGGSKMWVRVDTDISLENLLRGVIVQSGNDACIVIAENISGSEEAFADLMTRKAREWGMNNSTFSNATGWPDDGQKMSMRDLGILARKIIRDYPEYYAIFAEREFTWEKIRQENRNPLLNLFDGADGLKTGHTEESGFGLVASARRNGERRIIVVNGLGSEKERATEAQRLMRIAFDDFTQKTLYMPGDIVGEALVFKGKDKSVPLITHEAVELIVHRSSADTVNAKMVYEGPVGAPIAENQQIGFLRVELPGGDAREYPLFAGRAVEELGIFGKIALAARTLLVKPESETEASAQ
ncbi:MAG: D-alanyl-D-alanine carboxypeptidase family protein [Parvularculaceae bacterium]